IDTLASHYGATIWHEACFCYVFASGFGSPSFLFAPGRQRQCPVGEQPDGDMRDRGLMIDIFSIG
ncbi:hypothetical protein, partial [Haematobacter missouriensis]|uniref:hypothetical protein n=1 Tax=Haematobacter missouriensis TaxID=366616 RepID=UPI001E4E6395